MLCNFLTKHLVILVDVTKEFFSRLLKCSKKLLDRLYYKIRDLILRQIKRLKDTKVLLKEVKGLIFLNFKNKVDSWVDFFLRFLKLIRGAYSTCSLYISNLVSIWKGLEGNNFFTKFLSLMYLLLKKIVSYPVTLFNAVKKVCIAVNKVFTKFIDYFYDIRYHMYYNRFWPWFKAWRRHWRHYNYDWRQDLKAGKCHPRGESKRYRVFCFWCYILKTWFVFWIKQFFFIGENFLWLLVGSIYYCCVFKLGFFFTAFWLAVILRLVWRSRRAFIEKD